MSLASSALSIWTQRLEGAADPGWSRSLPQRLVVAGRVVWFYLGKLAWPEPLTFIYRRWQVDSANPEAYIPLAAACAVLAFLWWKRHGWLRPVLFAYAYFLAALLPVLGLVDQFFWRYSFVGDHFQYLASIGPLALAAAAIATALALLPRGRVAAMAVVSGVLLSALGVLAARQCPKYVDSETLWRATLAENPGAWMAHNNLGAELMHAGRISEAVVHFQAALDLESRNVAAQSNLGDGLLQLGRTEEAFAHYRKALELDPRNTVAQTNMGAALLQVGRAAEAVPHLRVALESAPGYVKARINLGSAYLQLGRAGEAEAEFARALSADPGNAEAATDLGTVYAQEGRLDKALAQFQEAVRLKPNFATALTDLGNVLLQQGHADEAIARYGDALRADPNSAVTHNNLAYALLQAGRLDEAIAHYRRALELRPDYPEARRNLGVALTEKRRSIEAGSVPGRLSPPR
jgi:tetratricopeptide (TPR) repeat protein